jgi:hypothetical protein
MSFVSRQNGSRFDRPNNITSIVAQGIYHATGRNFFTPSEEARGRAAVLRVMEDSRNS